MGSQARVVAAIEAMEDAMKCLRFNSGFPLSLATHPETYSFDSTLSRVRIRILEELSGSLLILLSRHNRQARSTSLDRSGLMCS